MLMQVFFPYPDDLIRSAQALDDRRLLKQISELCQILTSQYNGVSFPAAARGWAAHPVVKIYDTPGGRSLLLRYGAALCAEYRFRFGKQHQAYFTLIGLRAQLPSRAPRGILAEGPRYIKGSGPEQVVTEQGVGERYQALLLEKWNESTPVWTRREPPPFYQKTDHTAVDISTE